MKSRPLWHKSPLPLLVEPEFPQQSAVEAFISWAERERGWVQGRLEEHGGILFRGFAVSNAQEFERFCLADGKPLQRYLGGNTPRKPVEGVYTSTEYPSHLSILQHCEMSYVKTFPQRIYFHCLQPAETGGETPIANGTDIYAAIAPEVARRFADRGLTYISNFHGGFGLGKSWMESFETEDRSEVEEICRNSGLRTEWSDNGSLRTKAVRPGVTCHPRSGKPVWFNQAEHWHVSSLDPNKQAALLEVMREEELPRCVAFGDGTPIDRADLDEFRRASRECELAFPWQKGDVMVLDNTVVTHGRRPFTGNRRILVAMT